MVKIGNTLVKNTNKVMKKLSPKYVSFFILFLILFIIWYFTRKEGLETKTDGSGCLVSDRSADGVDSSFNVSVSCEQFKEVLMGSTLDEFSSLN
jgi:hypothetical protein